MREHKYALGVLFAILVVAAAALYWGDLREVGKQASKPTAEASKQDNSAPLSQRTPKAELEQELALAAGKLRTCKNSVESRRALVEITEWLSSLTPDESPAPVREFLRSGADAPTGLGFQLGADGLLTEAPTLRVHLLDLLARVAPKQSAALAREVLGVSQSPDEWAICLRNFAANDSSPEKRVFLEGKFLELLANESWKENPSTGFLEAFDVTVFLGGTNLIPALSEALRNRANPALAHAAFLSLDRLVLQEPNAVMDALLESPALMDGRESTRAGYFARADLSDPAQRKLVETYLLDPGRNPAELEAFAGVFPNANYMVSHNLLTRQVTPDRAALTRWDRESLAIVETWLADPRFQPSRAQLFKVRQRLQQYVAEAEANR
jgi:hypothetical protein